MQGAVLTASIPVIDAETGEEISRGEIPPWCVAVQSTRSREFFWRHLRSALRVGH